MNIFLDVSEQKLVARDYLTLLGHSPSDYVICIKVFDMLLMLLSMNTLLFIKAKSFFFATFAGSLLFLLYINIHEILKLALCLICLHNQGLA